MPHLPYVRSDVACEYPLKEMLDYHRARGAEATILVTKVADASTTASSNSAEGAGSVCCQHPHYSSWLTDCRLHDSAKQLVQSFLAGAAAKSVLLCPTARTPSSTGHMHVHRAESPRSAPRCFCCHPSQVDDPSKYGVLIINEYGQVQQFVEKPKVRQEWHIHTWQQQLHRHILLTHSSWQPSAEQGC